MDSHFFTLTVCATRPTSTIEQPSEVSGLYSCSQLADMYGLPTEALRKRLERWQKTNDRGWLEVTDRRQTDPRYLYRLDAVKPLLSRLAGDVWREVT